MELNETRKQLVKIELQAQKRSQQIIEYKKEIAMLQLKIEELEGVKINSREKERKMGKDLGVLAEEINRRDAKIAKLDSERLRSEEMLGSADARLVSYSRFRSVDFNWQFSFDLCVLKFASKLTKMANSKAKSLLIPTVKKLFLESKC